MAGVDVSIDAVCRGEVARIVVWIVHVTIVVVGDVVAGVNVIVADIIVDVVVSGGCNTVVVPSVGKLHPGGVVGLSVVVAYVIPIGIVASVVVGIECIVGIVVVGDVLAGVGGIDGDAVVAKVVVGEVVVCVARCVLHRVLLVLLAFALSLLLLFSCC